MFPRFAHSLFWLMQQALPKDFVGGGSVSGRPKSSSEVSAFNYETARYYRRLKMLMRALQLTCGKALMNAFLKQERMMQVG